MGSHVVTPEDVLQLLMNDGTVDSIRMKVIAQLKANEQMKRDTMIMVQQSNVLNTPGAEKQSKRDLFDALRRELETPVLEKAAKAVWELIIANEGLGKDITDTVDRAYCRITGLTAPPAASVPATEDHEGNGNEERSENNRNGNGERSENNGSDNNRNGNGETSENNRNGNGERSENNRKRSFDEDELDDGEQVVANGDGNGKRHLVLDSSEDSENHNT